MKMILEYEVFFCILMALTVSKDRLVATESISHGHIDIEPWQNACYVITIS